MIVLLIISALCFAVYFLARSQYNEIMERMYRRDSSTLGRLFSYATNQSLNDVTGAEDDAAVWQATKTISLILGIILFVIAMIVACA